MKERLSGRVWRDIASRASWINSVIFKRLAVEAGSGGEASPKSIAEHMLQKMNVSVERTEKNNPDFPIWKKKLSEKPGIIICDHPLRIEVLAILSMVERSDVKAIASRLTVEMAAPVFGKEYFIEVDPNASRSGVKESFNRAQSHIDSGGLLILFPGGSSQRDQNAPFRSGFRNLIKRISPDAMVYACKADSGDVEGLRKGLLWRLASLAVPGLRPKSEKRLRIEERYTEASWWQEAIRGESPAEDNRALTERYLSIFRKG